MNCTHQLERLDRWVEGDLSVRECEAFKVHVQECASCRAAMEEVGDLVDLFLEDPVPQIERGSTAALERAASIAPVHAPVRLALARLCDWIRGLLPGAPVAGFLARGEQPPCARCQAPLGSDPVGCDACLMHENSQLLEMPELRFATVVVGVVLVLGFFASKLPPTGAPTPVVSGPPVPILVSTRPDPSPAVSIQPVPVLMPAPTHPASPPGPLPADRFRALSIRSTDMPMMFQTSLCEFNLAGQLSSPCYSVPSEVFSMATDPKGPTYYGMTQDGVKVLGPGHGRDPGAPGDRCAGGGHDRPGSRSSAAIHVAAGPGV
jgi:hypothetical protein